MQSGTICPCMVSDISSFLRLVTLPEPPGIGEPWYSSLTASFRIQWFSWSSCYIGECFYELILLWLSGMICVLSFVMRIIHGTVQNSCNCEYCEYWVHAACLGKTVVESTLPGIICEKRFAASLSDRDAASLETLRTIVRKAKP